MPRPLPRPLLDPSLRDKVLRGGVRLQGSSFQPGGRGMEGLAIPIVIVLALGIMTFSALIIMNTLAVIQIVCLDLSRLNEQNNNIILERQGI